MKQPSYGRTFVCAAVLLVVITAEQEAQGLSPSTHIRSPFVGERPMELGFHAGFDWDGFGPAVGARFGIPLVDNGFISRLNNAVYLNFGADFHYIHVSGELEDGFYPALGLPITFHWEFYFTERWSAFGELGINIFFHPYLFHGEGFHVVAGHWVIGTVGGRFHFNDSVAIVLRLGNPYNSFGVSFFF